MKKNIGLLFCLTVFLIGQEVSADASTRTARGISETEQLGITAGVALACHADEEQLKNYEMIASRIIVNPVSTEKEEREVLRLYAQAKLKAYEEQIKFPEIACREVLNRFYNQPIFKSVVYRDGTIKLPDGKIIKPQRPVVNAKKTTKKMMTSQKD